MYSVLTPIYWVVILGLPLTLAAAPVLVVTSLWLKFACLFAAPFLFGLIYPSTCGLLSRPHKSAIQQGEFPRDLANPIYGRRRLYGLCWVAVYYFMPLYNVVLSIPWLKGPVFRCFGYHKDLNFTVYPDTWLRDLPLLDFAAGAYLSNRATIGTNVVLNNGNIFVSGITIGEKGLVGHLAMLAPGASVGAAAEIGVGVAQGLSVVVGPKARVGPSCTLNHASRIGANANIGTMSYVGLNAVIGPGIKIPAGALVPRDIEITNQKQVDDIVSSETRDLNRMRTQLADFMLHGL